MSRRIAGSTLNSAILGLLFFLAFLGFTAAPAAEAKTITIKAVFKYRAPDSTDKPVRYAYVELRDSDTISDDVIAQSYTAFDGSVTFQYDSGLDDGWWGGRIDPYVRCYPKLYMPSYDMSNVSGQTEWTYLACVGRGTGFAFVEPSYATIDTPTWDDNDSDRSAAVTASGEAAAAFFILDCAAAANLPTSDENHRAPLALGDHWCFPGAAFDTGLPKTAYMPDTEVILIDVTGFDTALEFDSTVHEYGHREMCRYYGSTFGNYDCTRSNHSFEEPLKNKWYLPSDAEWSALAEGWADFCPVITKRLPIYRGAYDVETVQGANLSTASGSCEGTVCRIFWDIADTWQDKTLDFDEKVIDRPLVGGMALDDDPFGFTDRPPYSGLPGLEALKDIIRRDNPKSLWQFRDAWRTKFRANRNALRALDAVFWINGLLRGQGELQENPPSCALSISGATTPVKVNGEARNAYTGDVTLTADVVDLDPDDRPFLHVYFYWAYPSVAPGLEGSIPNRSQWKPIGVDVGGSNGFSVVWPKGKDRPLPGKAVCLIAVASDFMQESAYTLSFDPVNRTGGQIWNVVFGEATEGGGGTGEGKPSGPLTEVGYFGGLGTALGIRVYGDNLYIAGWGQGLLIVDISTPESPRIISKFRPSDITWNDNSRDVDIFAPAGPSGGGRVYAIIAYGSAGMRIVDVTNPAKPFQVGGIGGREMYPDRVRVAGSHAIFWGVGRSVVDISSPARPGSAVPWLRTTMLVNRHEVTDIAIAGDAVYLACLERGLAILSLADILALKNSEPIKGREDEQIQMIRGSYTNGHRLIALDVLETKPQGRRLAMCLYLAEPVPGQKSPPAWKYCLSVLDVTEPKNIKEVEAFDLENFPDDVAVDGSNVFVGHSRGVTLFDFTDPSAPKKVCTFKGSAVYAGGEMAFYKDYIIVLVAHDHIGVLKLNK